MIVFDKSNPQSFVHIDSWLNEVNKYVEDSCVKLLVGNKCDLTSAIDKDIAGLDYIETSAKNGFQVDDAFIKLAKE